MKTRREIDPAYQWKLDAVFPDDAAWEEAFVGAEKLAEDFLRHAGKLNQSADALFDALSEQSALERRLERLYAYAFLHKSEDNGNAAYQGMTDRAMQLYVEAASNSAFFVPEVLAIPGETLREWAEEARFAPFRFALYDIDRGRPHTLSAPEERLMAMAEEPLSGPDNIFTMLSDVDMTFGRVVDGDGAEVELTHGSYGRLMQSADRRVRRDAYLGMYGAYRKFGNTVAATYSASVKADVFRARAHRFPGALEAALFANDVPTAVYDQLISAVHEKLPVLQTYLKLRKRMLGLDQLEMYDLYVPIVSDCDERMPYAAAQSLVREALAPLGEGYQKLLDEAYRDGWIDVYETPGKTSGAFCDSVYGTHPYVLLNYQDRMEDAFTLAHELGHAMHSYHSDAAQPYELSRYSIMVAEVASTVNETLLTRYLLNTEKDQWKRAYYLNHFLEQFRTTCYRQTMFAEFERKAHEMAGRGEPLTVESLGAVYRALNEQYYAGVHVDDNIACEWMRIPHFYNAFYVYQYATGLCTAVKLADDVLHGGALEQYLAFLAGGGSDYPIALLKKAGMDLTGPEGVLAALDEFERCVEELAGLLEQAASSSPA